MTACFTLVTYQYVEIANAVKSRVYHIAVIIHNTMSLLCSSKRDIVFFSSIMPPIRHRDCRATSPLMVRRIMKDLSINVSLANSSLPFIGCSETDELELALAAKERELSSLTSPSSSSTNVALNGAFYRLCYPTFPETIDSFQSFNEMKATFLTYLTQNHLLELLPESKFYQYVYFPYGYQNLHCI